MWYSGINTVFSQFTREMNDNSLGCVLSSLWNVAGLRAISILIGHISHRVRLAIRSSPSVAASHFQSCVLLSRILQLSLFLTRCAIAGLITGEVKDKKKGKINSKFQQTLLSRTHANR